jgi:hypothetical protein
MENKNSLTKRNSRDSPSPKKTSSFEKKEEEENEQIS